MKGYKTIITAVLSIAASFLPGMGEWISANPEEYATLIGGVMIVLRILTKTPIGKSEGADKLPSLLPIFLAVGAAATLSSCQTIPGLQPTVDRVGSALHGLSARIGTDGTGAVMEVTVPPGVGVGAKLYAVTPGTSRLPKPAPELPILETYPAK